MKTLLIFLSLTSLSYRSWSQTREIHVDEVSLKKCSTEVLTLGCGTPNSTNEESFMNCVDKKLSGLSQECQDLHKTLRDQRN